MLKSNRGFLLFEVAIAIVILSVGMTFVLRSFNSAIASVKGLQGYTTAMFLLGQKMFDLEDKGIKKCGTEGDFGIDYPGFSWKLDSVLLEDAPLDKVQLSVMWHTPNSTRKFSAATFLKHEA